MSSENSLVERLREGVFGSNEAKTDTVLHALMIQAANEIESLRQQLASRDAEVALLKADNEYLYIAAIERDQLREQVTLLRDAILNRMSSENHWPEYIIEALADTEPK